MIRNNLAAEISLAGTGFLVAACVPALILAVVSPLGGYRGILSVLGTIFVVYPFSLMFTVLLGLPAFLLLRPFTVGSFWLVSAVGFVLGVLFLSFSNGNLPSLYGAVLWGAIGMLTALAFWIFWRKSQVAMAG